MDFDGSRYYTINRLMLSSIGLWPYQNISWSIRAQRFCCLLCFTSCVLSQLLTFVTFEYNLDLLLEVLSFTVPYLIVILKYVAFCVKTDSMRKIMTMIKYDWNILSNEMEYNIMHKYTYIGAFYAQFFAIIAFSIPVLVFYGHLIPDILDFIDPLNQSRTHQLLILAEYFVDNEKYFYCIVLHITFSILLFQITLLFTTSLYVMYVQHMCGLFQIASYRIEHALDDYEKDNLIFNKHCTACARIIGAINVHRRAIMFLEFMTNTFIIMYFCLLFLGVASLTINIYCAVITEGFEIISSLISVFIHLYYFFLVNYSGQKVLDQSTIFLLKTYNSKWHMMPLHVQKLILFIMQRSTKSCMLLIGGIFVASLEGFATALSTSLSYFMVIYSTR